MPANPSPGTIALIDPDLADFPFAAIATRLGLATTPAISTLTGGYSHHVIAFGDQHVLRIARPDRAHRLLHEATAIALLESPELASIRGRVPVAVFNADAGRLSSSGEANRWTGWHVLVTNRFRGQNAFRAWMSATPQVRSGWITQIVALARTVHRLRVTTYAAPLYDDRAVLIRCDADNPTKPGVWRNRHEIALDGYASLLHAPNSDVARVIAGSVARCRDVIETITPGSGARLGHGDLHLHNVMVDGPEVTGIIDWEWASGIDPDADFAHLLRWSLFPAHPADEDLEAFVHQDDFTCVPEAIWHAYPEVARLPDLEARLTAHLILYDLRQLGQFPDSAQAITRLRAWMAGAVRHLLPRTNEVRASVG